MTSLSPNDLMGRATLFANELPDLHNIRSSKNKIMFEFVMEGQLPVAKWKYQTEYIDRYAVNAWKKIFHDQNRIELARKGFMLTFIVYFWSEEKIIGEMEFNYSINNELFKVGQVA